MLCSFIHISSTSRAVLKHFAVGTHVSLLFASPLLCCCCVECTICALCSHSSPRTLTTSLIRHSVMAEHKRSAVWSYFTAVNENVVNCDACRKALHGCGSITNSFKHIKKKEKENTELQQRRKEEEGNASSATRPPTLSSLAEPF